ncbi:MAG: hypothetical protein ACK6D7_05990 [Acidobacteriota bacterium]
MGPISEEFRVPVVTDGTRLLPVKIGRAKGRRGPEVPPWVRARRG